MLQHLQSPWKMLPLSMDTRVLARSLHLLCKFHIGSISMNHMQYQLHKTNLHVQRMITKQYPLLVMLYIALVLIQCITIIYQNSTCDAETWFGDSKLLSDSLSRKGAVMVREVCEGKRFGHNTKRQALAALNTNCATPSRPMESSKLEPNRAVRQERRGCDASFNSVYNRPESY